MISLQSYQSHHVNHIASVIYHINHTNHMLSCLVSSHNITLIKTYIASLHCIHKKTHAVQLMKEISFQGTKLTTFAFKIIRLQKIAFESTIFPTVSKGLNNQSMDLFLLYDCVIQNSINYVAYRL